MRIKYEYILIGLIALFFILIQPILAPTAYNKYESEKDHQAFLNEIEMLNKKCEEIESELYKMEQITEIIIEWYEVQRNWDKYPKEEKK